MVLHENRLPADGSHEISCLFVIFENAAKFEIVVCCKLLALYVSRMLFLLRGKANYVHGSEKSLFEYMEKIISRHDIICYTTQQGEVI